MWEMTSCYLSKLYRIVFEELVKCVERFGWVRREVEDEEEGEDEGEEEEEIKGL